MDPAKAVRTSSDYAICGNCPERRNLGGACYVLVQNAPLSVYRAWNRGKYSSSSHIARVKNELLSKPLRIGSYGDPAAVPFGVWEELLAEGCGRYTGYTHQWRRRDSQLYRRILMASCDSPTEAIEAKAKGWRYFLVTHEKPASIRGEVECLSDAQNMTCADCGICDGTRADSRSLSAASVAIQVHGSLAKRFQLPVLN